MTPDGPDDDARAFQEAVRGARPLDEGHGRRVPVDPARPGPAPGRARAAPTASPVASEAASGAFDVRTAGETIAGRANGVDARVLRQLKAGKVQVDATLDLHGRPRAAALPALERFVHVARDAGKRCVLVIHGRGAHSSEEGPVLKPLVWRWLEASPAAAAAVLAFASARPAQGGDGATLLLLRKPGR